MHAFDFKTPKGSLRLMLLCLFAALGAACGGEAGNAEPVDGSHSAFSPSLPANTTACAPTPAASATYGGKTYYRYRSTTTTTWMGSKSACEAAGGQLAIPSSAGANSAIFGLISDKEMWIGLFQPWGQTQVNQNWQNVDGTALASYHNWGGGQPNDSDNIENDGQNCSYMFHTGTDAGKWNDWPCYQAYDTDYVCEFASSPGTCTGTTSCQIGTGATTYSCLDTCTLAWNTTATTTVNTNGCAVLTRDTSSCLAARQAAGLTGAWLKFSCRVSLTRSTTGGVTANVAATDNRPDYRSFYFTSTDACYEAWAGNPNKNNNNITTESWTINFPASPTAGTMPASMGGYQSVGLAVNGVSIFSNVAAPGDDIYLEAVSFDKCSGHPQNTGVYHYHAEPNAITNNDANLVGVMRDGYPIYGRKDSDGTYPTVDTSGGHTGTTPDSTTAVYHYHVNLQTSATTTATVKSQWFITTGFFHGVPGSCTGGC